MGWRRLISISLAASVVAGMFLLPSRAQADFHFIKIREVFPGGAAGSSYVVLQMYAAFQGNLAPLHHIDVYGATGNLITTFTFSSDAANAQNQATVLVADTGYSAAFPSGPTPDAEHSALDIPAAGGAVCFDAPDCVSWGNFSGSLPSPTGSPASPAGVTAAKALHRSIAAACSLRLENADDSQDSAIDFSEQEPNPRNNVLAESPIVEESCNGPNATITGKPASSTNSTAAAFTYESLSGGATFECWLDGDPFEACDASGIEYPGPLAEGGHIFRVRASDGTGTGTSASYSWTIDRTAPTTTINNPKPQNGTQGDTVSFSYLADEGGVSFECRLSPEPSPDFEPCPAVGKTYTNLEDGPHTFEVQGTDAAGNLGAPATHTWTVDNSAPDTQPPQTFVDTAPPDPSTSSMAVFTYHADELGSSFECKLDGGAFVACPNVGIAYSGLGNGSHSFQVRARDSSENVDETPAGYTWDVVLTVPPPAPPPGPPPPEPEPEPGTAAAAGVAPVRGAVALLSMRCRGEAGARCSGVLRLVARVGAARSSGRRARRLTIGSVRYRLPAGKRRVVRVPLTRQGKGLVRRAGPRGLRVSLVGKGIRNRALVLKPAVRREKRAKRRPTIARASAFHLIRIREVHAGAADDSYVVLQMLAAGENFVGGHSLRIYDSSGATLHTFTFSPGYVAPNGSHGNNTILVGDTGVQSRFGIEPDDHADGGLDIPAGGGAVCWLSGSPVDCAAWGDFSGHGALPAPGAGAPADPLGIPAGMALRRTIARGCATLLDAADDSDDSAADFSDAFPAPRPNSVPPSERPCSDGGEGSEIPGGGGGAAGAASVQTRIVRGPGRVTRDRSPSFRFRANRPASFRCRQDGRPARRCRSPFTLRRLSFGCHVFRVSARAGRSTDRTPVVYPFRVVKRRQPGLRQFRPCRPARRRGG